MSKEYIITKGKKQDDKTEIKNDIFSENEDEILEFETLYNSQLTGMYGSEYDKIISFLEIFTPLETNTTFAKIAEYFDEYNNFENTYQTKKIQSPNLQQSLKLWIEEIEDRLKINTPNEGKYNDWNFDCMKFAYFETVKVNDPTLNDLKKYITITFTEELENWILLPKNLNISSHFKEIKIIYYILSDIAKGVVYAHKLPELKKELNNLTNGIAPTTELETIPNTTKEKGTFHTTQFIILKELGFFDLPKFKDLTTKDKGKLLSNLLNMNIDNATDYTENIYDTKGGTKKSPYNKTAIKQAKAILTLININLPD